MNTGYQESRFQVRAWWAAVALLAGGFAVAAYRMLRQATAVNWQDTEGYLGNTLYIAEHGGLLGFLRESFTGTFPVVERHPLYMLLLTPFAERSHDFFYAAKVVNLVTGVIALLTLIWMVARRYGRGPALIAGIVFAFSSSLLIASSHVNNEGLFTICALWTWWFLTHPHVADPSINDPLTTMPPPHRWAIAGVFLGLAYLTKSPATLIGLAIVVAGVWHARLRFLTNARLWVLLLVTAIVSSPLTVRNLVGFGTPIYEGVNSSIMWLDDWSDLGDEGTVRYFDRDGIVTLEKSNLPTARDYLATHSALDIAKRMTQGLYTEIFVVVPKALAPPFPRLHSGLGQMWGLAILGLAVAAWWLRRRQWEAPLVFFWSGAFLLFFGWNHMFPDIRYVAPLVPIWIAYASYAAWLLVTRLLEPQRALRFATVGVCAVMVLVAGSTIARGQLTEPRPVATYSRSYARLLDWINTNIVAGDRMLLGPTTEFYGLLWSARRPVSVVAVPKSTSLEGFQRYLRDRNVRYLVLNTENARGNGGRLTQALAPYVEVTPDGEIVEKEPLPGWVPVYEDPSPRRRFIIYESRLVMQQKARKRIFETWAPPAPTPTS